ncbi:DUF2190 family protein [Rhodococcus sp. D2-41]|uniref:capsid cement protein n=1 Tax=Speluncibacter jeojiensis TaxID=2710754 RepID=UPI00240FC3B8|nr:capsid cement protein [Rhodococcus sp. D2-41]MDG3012153.1 DUF2190 family protein [Rhodococcus sp. D2-41]
MSDYAPIFDDGDEFTLTTSAAVTGGQLLAISGDKTVAPTSTATAAWVGVAAYDAPSGARVTVLTEGVQELAASAAITAGAAVIPAASGKVATIGSVTDYSQVVGVAISTAADGKVWVKLAR